MAAGIGFMDVRATRREGTSLRLEDGKVHEISQDESLSAGIRVLDEGAWGFASAKSIERRELDDALNRALTMARRARTRVLHPAELAKTETHTAMITANVEVDPRSVPLVTKIALLCGLEQQAIAAGQGTIRNTSVYFSEDCTREAVCNTLGTCVDQEEIRTSLGGSFVAVDGSVRQQAYEYMTNPVGWEMVDSQRGQTFAAEAGARAASLLRAKRAPSGKFTVILHPAVTGLFTHEALGHNAEADLVFNGESILDGKLGTRIGSEQVTIIDDATIPRINGSFQFDSEGTPAQRKVLVDRGILAGYMHSLESAGRFGVRPTGNGRVMSSVHRPLVRMSNTFIAPGKLSFEDLIKDIDSGIYMKGGHWGYVMCERGQYTCHVGEGWMIRNGQLCEHLRDVSFTGMTLDTLANIDAVSKDLEFQLGGMCGKNGQGVWVDAGGPYVRVRNIVVGGQE